MSDDLLDTSGVDAGGGADTTASNADAGGGDAGKQGGKPEVSAKAPAEGAGNDSAAADLAGKDGAAGAGKDDGEVDLDEGGEGSGKTSPKWPDNWREQMAAGDEKLAKRLQRFGTPDKLLKSWLAAEQKISSGEYRRASLPENATDEEKAEWRKQNGIPEKPEEYGLPEVKGHEWTDADKAIVGTFLSDLHKAGTPKGIAEQALRWYAGFAQQQKEARASLDQEARVAREDALRAEWAPGEYRQHINLAKQTLNDDAFIPKDLRLQIASARTADGRRLIDVPELTLWLAQQGLERRGPGGLISGEQGARMGSRIDEIKRIRSTDIDKYYADGLDKELAELSAKMEGAGGRR